MSDRRFEAIGWIAVIVVTICASLLFVREVLDEGMSLRGWLYLLTAVFHVGVIVNKASSKAKSCPKCGSRLPKWRMPKDTHEAFVGGWTCANCGTKPTGRLDERKLG